MDVLGSLDRPNWSLAERRFGWQYYIPDQVREAWDDQSADARVAAYAFAVRLADQDSLLAQEV